MIGLRYQWLLIDSDVVMAIIGTGNKMLTSVVLCVYLILCTHSEARNPGVKIHLSKYGLNYAKEIAVDDLQKSIKNRGIPNHEDTSGDLSYRLSNIRINRFTRPESSLVIDQGVGITASLTNAALAVKGDWSYRYKVAFIPIRDSGSFDVNINRVSIKVAISMGADDNGRPTIRTRSCHSDVDGVDVKIHGGASWLYNMFTSPLRKHIKSELQSQLCDHLEKMINVRIKKTLHKMKVIEPVSRHFTLDYSLVAAPVFKSNYMESLHKGELFWTANQTEAPYQPEAIEDLPNKPKFLSVYISDYLMHTAGYTLFTYKRQFVMYNLTKKDLSEKNRHYLDIDAFPQISKKFSNSSIELFMYCTKPPSISTVNGTIIGRFRGKTEFKIRKLNGELLDWFTLGMKANIIIKATLTGHIIKAKVLNYHFGSKVIQTNGDPVPKPLIDFLYRLVFRDFIIPSLNAQGKKGLPLPHLDNVQYVDPELDIMTGVICFNVDLKYDPSV